MNKYHFLFTLFTASVFVTSAQPTEQVCQNGWIKNGTSCYLFATHVLDDWTEAEYFCHLFNSKLVEIETKQENQFLRAQARKELAQGSSGKAGFWIGATDAVAEGQWMWASSQKLLKFEDWGNNFPDDWESNEDCAHMWSGDDFEWNDTHCDEKMNFICEQELETPGELIIG